MSNNLSVRVLLSVTHVKTRQWVGILGTLAALVLLGLQPATAQTCVFNGPITASHNPFGTCPAGTDTIIVRDSFAVDINYEPIIGGVPFEGVLIVDGGKIDWVSNVWLKLGYAAKVVLMNGGMLAPPTSNAPECNGTRSLYFDTKKTVNCNGIGAPHAFQDVNMAGCVTEIGICCNAFMLATDSSGNVNDRTLCQFGDTAHLSVLGSGTLGYNYTWTPNLGPGAGVYPVVPQNNSVYTVAMSATFDPYGPEPPYVLTCSGSVQFKINPHINLSASATSVPCQNVATGSISLNVSGGTAPYKYLWSNGLTIKNLTNLTGGTYTVTVTDAKGCSETLTATVAVQDNTPPTLSCPPNAVDVADPNSCTTLVSNINATFSDNCPTVGVTYTLSGATTGSGAGQLSNTVPFRSGITTVTYKVDDGSNAVTCSFTVNVQDTQFPTASSPPPISGIQCASGIPAPDPAVVTTAADNCTPIVTFVSDNVVGGGGCPVSPLVISRRYRVSDAAGNSIIVTQTIQVADSQAPVFTFVPANTTVNCQSVPAVGVPTATDNCTANASISYKGETRTDGPCPDTYILKRRWTATDNCGNSVSAEQVITVQDQIAPVFTAVPSAVTVNCDAVPAVGAPSASDNCDAAVAITYEGQIRTDGACPDTYTLLRRWTAADNCGNTQTAEQLITVRDIVNPAFTFVPANVTVSCNAVPAVGTPTASDNCDAAVAIVYNGEIRTDGACPDTYTLQRRWTATDNCGNTATAEQHITVQDIVKPVFTAVPSNVTVSCDAVPSVGAAVASDNCDVAVTVNFVDEVRSNGTCPDKYTLTRRWMATDNCGNTAMATQVVTVQDVTKPVFTFVPANVTTACEAVPTVGVPTATDNCTATVAIMYDGETRTNGSCLNTYTLTRHWTATDNCGNTTSAVQVIAVQDVVAPVFTSFPAPVTVSCNAVPAVGSPAATDNCDAAVVITYNGQTRSDGPCPDTYTLTRRWTATDNCANSVTVEQIIAVQDVVAPVFTSIPSNTTVNCQAIPPVGTPLATDNCDAGVAITYNGEIRADGACPDTYTLTRRWTATDNCGNTKTAEQAIAVQDVTKPVFTFVPANVTVQCNAIPAVGTPAASDNCDAAVVITYNGETHTDGACPDTYTLKRRWTATDNCGNTASAEQTIAVQDVTAPLFTFTPANTTVNCDAVPAVGMATASDNCDAAAEVVFVEELRTNGACPDKYTLTRRWKATDNCGNSALTTQIITVQDVTLPVFTFVPADVTTTCETIPSVGTPAASDNCTAAVAITFNGEVRTNGACPDTYTLTRRWTAADNCGNSTSAVQVVTVRDLTPPAFTSVPAAVTVNCQAIPAVGAPAATDNCDAAVTITYDGQTRTDGACPDTYTLTRRWTAADNCGNTVSAVQVIAVQDVTPPVFTFIPPNGTVNCEAIPNIQDPVATDNCDATVSIVFNGVTQTSGSCASGGTVKRSWTAMDNCGNTAIAEQILVVQDTTKPVFTFVPANLTVGCEAVPAVGTPLASDNCTATIPVTYDGETRVDGACPDTYTLKRRWTATDICGNTRTAVQTLTVRDITPPVITSAPADITVGCDAVPAPVAPVATDNCDAAVTVHYDGEVRVDGTCPDKYTLRRHWTLSDNCGNTATLEQRIEVQDNTAPVFTFVPADATVSCDAVPLVGLPSGSDNCSAAVKIFFSGEVYTKGSCVDAYSLRRNWIIVDNCANSATAEQVLMVEDKTAPVFTSMPADVTVSCDAVPAAGVATASDNCAVNVVVAYAGETRADGACADSYTLTRRWTATDNCGNTADGEQRITVADNTPPVFTAVPLDVTVDCEAVPAIGVPVATDNCTANVTLVFAGETRTDGACFDTYTLVRRWTATDHCGNSATAVQTVVVKDTTRPDFTMVPENVTVSCDAVPAVIAPTASDNCATEVKIVYVGETRTDGACPDSYTLTRRWTATDNCGNQNSTEQVVTVQDTKAPVFVFVPADKTVQCNAIPAVGTPTASDDCAATVSMVYTGQTRTDGNCPSNYTLRRRWSATDNCGNVATAEQVLTVQDTTRPVFALVPQDVVVNCEAIPAVGSPLASDNCTVPVSLTYDGETRTDGACPDTYTLFRRWTAADNCGNSSTAVQQITVRDITSPTFTSVLPDITVSCDAVPAPDMPTASDNCATDAAIAYEGETRADGACPDTYVLTRRWTATDNCGNSASTQQTITVQDLTRPVFTFIPADATVNCEAIPALGVPQASDDCDGDVAISFAGEEYTGGNCASGGMLLRRWKAMDNCGNYAVAEQHLTVQDTTRPVFTFKPANITVSCEAVPAVEIPLASDNCTTNVAVQFNGETRTDGACLDTYILRRRWTASDLCSNSASIEQIITVHDIKAPVFTDIPANVTVSCEAVPVAGAPVATDNCDAGVQITYNGEVRLDGLCPDSYLLRRRWTAADNCGNTVSAEQVITVRDITPPVFTSAPLSITVSCADVPAAGMPTASDNCDANVAIAYDGEVRTDGACPDTYSLKRRWTATDNCGNFLTTVQVITVQDNTPPVFTTIPPHVTVNCDAVPSVGIPAATDNCALSLQIVYDGETRTDGLCPDSYLLRRRWTVADNCGNSKTAEQIITVRDITPPVFLVAPADTVVGCDAVPPPAMPVVKDNCDASVSIEYLGETIVSSASASTYLLSRRWKATDNCGNSAVTEQLLSVRDTVSPVLVCPPIVATYTMPDKCGAIVFYEEPFKSDNCTSPAKLVASHLPGDEYPVGTTIVTLTATDDSGNSTTCTLTVTVADTTAPVLVNCPANMTVTTPGNTCEALVSWMPPSVTDPCDKYPIAAVPNTLPGQLFPTGVATITYTAQDTSGNTATCSFSVTVNETTPPVFTGCPANLTVQTTTCTAMANWQPPQATDNCQLDAVVSTAQPGDIFKEGNTLVRYKATDVWGNTAICDFTVTVQDIVPPSFSGCPSNMTVDANGDCSTVVNWTLPTATDNCDASPTVYAIPMPGAVYPVGHTNVLVVVEDPSGNTDTCTFKITVTGPPLGFSGTPASQSFIGCSAVATWTPPVPTGVCGPVTITSNFTPGSTFPVGTTTVVYTVADTLGYSATTSFNITVTESIVPQFTCPASPVVVDISGTILSDPSKFIQKADTIATCDGVELTFKQPVASDNCGVPTVAQLAGPVNGSIFFIGENVLDFQAKDDAGNTALCSVQVEVRPLQALNPLISDAIGCEGDDITLSTPVIPGATYLWSGPKAPYPNTNTLLIQDLNPGLTGIYTVQARVRGCLTPLDSALVRQAIQPDAVDDLDFEAETGGILDSINVLLNDKLEYDDYVVTVLTPLTGLTQTGNGLFSYQAGPDNGKVSFIYRLCSAACPDLCDEAVVVINVHETFCSYIPNIITPNDDGANDFLEIPCLDTELYPNNALIIYNQWGDKVFEASPYSNDPGTAWRGTLDGKAGQPLPDGTYFYYFRPDPNKSAKSGYIELFR